MKNNSLRYVSLILAGAATLALPTAKAQTITGASAPLPIVAPHALVDEFGAPLTREDGGSLVHILQANSGIVPPGYDGQPAAANPVLFTARIGKGVSPFSLVSKFSVSITPRPTGAVFVRVYNAPTLGDASFYTDSDVFNVVMASQTFYPNVSATTEPLDDRDTDGDGLINSWEKSMASRADLADSDGDGVSDYHEFAAGTGLNDDGDYLQVFDVVAVDSDTVEVSWRSAPDRRYQLERAVGDLTGPLAFQPVGAVITAGEGTLTTVLVDNDSGSTHFFRVKLLIDP